MLYLGLDCSTQSLTAIAIEIVGDARSVVWEHSLDFDAALPQYGTRHGVLLADDPRVAVSPPLMWAEALDRLLGDLAASGLDVSRLAAIAGSAQQHGSVYLNDTAAARLTVLDPARPLAPQMSGTFSRLVAPIWMDVSADEECREITRAMGGAARLARLTGSRAFERFTGPQIRRFFKHEPDRYAATERIHMVSSFMASLLAGAHAPLDPGDASGMNLMELSTNQWLPDALEATAPDLERRLPPVVPSWSVVGTLSPYWQRRHGLPAARLIAWSGDNSCSLIGTGLVRPGQLTVSLGTSDTVCGVMATPEVDRSGIGHVFGAPTGEFLALVCFRNGSLARERVRDRFGLDWGGFSAALSSTPAGNDGALMLPWFEPEITPDVPEGGVHVQGLEAAGAAAHVRAVVEGQMLAMHRHSRWMGVETRVIHATGGAAVNREILQVMADVFDAEVRQFVVSNAACLGAALRAFHGDCLAAGRPVEWDDVVRTLAEPVPGSAVTPVPAHVAMYREQGARAAAFERRARQPAAGGEWRIARLIHLVDEAPEQASAPETLETERLRLSRPRPSDAAGIFERYASDPEVTRYLAWPTHQTVADADAFVAFSDAQWATQPAGPYLIRWKDDGRLLGGTGLQIESDGSVTTGYVLARDAWGRGVATEALQAMVTLAGELGLPEVVAFCHAEHAASRRVLEKCGFTVDDARSEQAFPNLAGASRIALRYVRSSTG